MNPLSVSWFRGVHDNGTLSGWGGAHVPTRGDHSKGVFRYEDTPTPAVALDNALDATFDSDLQLIEYQVAQPDVDNDADAPDKLGIRKLDLPPEGPAVDQFAVSHILNMIDARGGRCRMQSAVRSLKSFGVYGCTHSWFTEHFSLVAGLSHTVARV